MVDFFTPDSSDKSFTRKSENERCSFKFSLKSMM
jgi:hypothetical protein